MGKQSITWIGHGSWKFVTVNGTVIYVDPWIRGNPACKISIEDTVDAQIVCVTHGHDDHIGNAIEICKNTGAVLVTLPDISAYAARHGIPADDRGGSVHTGGSVSVLDCRIRAVMALHASNVWGEEYQERGEIMLGTGCCGFVIEPEGGKPVYFAGDTGVFGDMSLISDLYHPYVSVLPIGDKYVMGPREAAVAAKLIKSPIIIPGHYNTFPAIQVDIDNFKKLVAREAPNTEVVALEPGMTYTFE